MADYNSPYTGAEVDAAVNKTDKIEESVKVWSGSPINVGVHIDNIPVNPGTGDKTGIYDIIFSHDTVSPEAAGSITYNSRLKISNTDANSIGVSHSYMTDDDIRAHGVNYYGNGTKLFDAENFVHTFSSGTASKNEMYIHEIWRLQKTQ